MISNVEIRNFQSLHHVELELAPLTVIVGKSSSGKSAVTRAIRMLTSNRRGTDFITHGQKSSTVKAVTDKGTVTLQRGKGTNDNSYTVIPHDDPSQQVTYKKLGGDVPEEVSQFIGIPSKDPINYAGQFDKPYLIADSSGGEAARVLGALTNVNVIFEAARESNRRKTAKSQTIRTKADDLEAIRNKIPAYKSLKQQAAALDTAEQLIQEATGLERRIARLTQATEQLIASQRAIETLAPYLALTVPDEKPIVQAAARVTQFRDSILEQRAAAAAEKTKREALDKLTNTEIEIQQEQAEALTQLATGFMEFFTAHSTTISNDEPRTIELEDAAELAARFIEDTLK